MANLLLPKDKVNDYSTPLFFLAGPIRGAPNWHNQAFDYLTKHIPSATIASPNPKMREDILEYTVNSHTTFQRQRAWERHYLDIASKKGSIIFWLPKEKTHNCNKVFGAMTRIELGTWMANYKHDSSINIVFGSDGKFPELSTIRYDLSVEAPDKKIFSSLEETCTEAVRLTKTNL